MAFGADPTLEQRKLSLHRQKRSVPRSPCSFDGVVTELSPSEIKMWGKSDMEICDVCGKPIYFDMYMPRGCYQWKQGKKYYCGYNHYRRTEEGGDGLTEKELKQYRSLLREIANQEKRIEMLRSREIPIVAGKVKASMKNFPYTEIRVGVQMEDPAESEEIRKLIIQKEHRISECRKLVLEIERFIKNIPDSEMRQIFEYRYIDGLKQHEIGELLNIDRSGVGKKIHCYLNIPTIPIK